MDGNIVFKLAAILGIDTSEYEKGLDKAKGDTHSFGGAIGKGLKGAVDIGVKALTVATGAVAAFGVSSVKTGAEFDKSMSQVAATMGLSMSEMKSQIGSVSTAYGEFSGNLREYAQYMGKNTAFSATQAADALNYMALAGYSVQESMNMLPNVLNLAAAGNMDLARASDMVTDTQTAFGLQMSQMPQLIDEMAKAASTGNTSVEQLGDAFLTIGGLAQELNGGLITLADGTTAPVTGVQELEVALTAMANAGIKGSEAGTHMRNMLLKLSSPTDEGAKAFKKLGIEVFDNEGKMRSLSAIMGQLDGALSNLTQEEKLQAISDIFNTRDTAAAEALMNAVGEDWDKIGESILAADGAAQKMADTQLDNLAGDVTLLKSAFEGLQIAVSDQNTGNLRKFVQLATRGVSDLTTAFSSFDASPYLDEMGRMSQEGAQAQAEFQKNRQAAIDDLFATITDGVEMIVDVAPQLIEGGVKLLEALAQGIVSNLPMIANAALDIAEYLLKTLADATSGGDGGAQVIEGIITSFTERLPALLELGIQVIVNLVNGIASALPTLIPVAVQAILTLASSFLDNIDSIIDAAINLIMALAEGLINALPILIEKAPEIVMKLVEAIVTNAPKLIVAAGELIGKLLAGIIQNLPRMISAGMSIITSLETGIVRLFFKIYKAGQDAIQKVWDGLKTLDPIQWGKDLIDNFIKGIKDRMAALGNAIADVASTIKSIIGFSEPEKGPLSNFHTYAPDMMDLFMQGVRENKGRLVNTIEDAFDFKNLITAPTMEYTMNRGTNSMIDGGSGFNQTVNIFSPESLTPSEVARQTRNATRDMVLELRGV